MFGRASILPLLVTLSGCALLFPEAYSDDDDVEVETGPDGLGTERPHVVVIGASGHPLNVTSGPYTEDLFYRGTLGVVAEVLYEGGTKLVYIWDHADAFYSQDASGTFVTPYESADVVSFGFLHLVEDLRWIRDNWVEPVEEPTRVVVVGHSHGVVWAHIAAQMVPDLPIDVMVDLDGDSEAWDGQGPVGLPVDGWDSVILDYTAFYSVTWPFEVWAARDAWQVDDSGELYDIEDVVPANVALDLEVRSDGQLLYDADSNIRMDGSVEGIEVFLSSQGHDEVADPTSDAMRWVVETLSGDD